MVTCNRKVILTAKSAIRLAIDPSRVSLATDAVGDTGPMRPLALGVLYGGRWQITFRPKN